MKGFLFLFCVFTLCYATNEDDLYVVVHRTKGECRLRIILPTYPSQDGGCADSEQTWVHHYKVFTSRVEALAWINQEFGERPEYFVSLRQCGAAEKLKMSAKQEIKDYVFIE